MKYAVIENNKVVNIVQSSAPLADNWKPLGDARLDWDWDGSKFVDPKTKLTAAQLKKVLRSRLESEYKSRLASATIGGMLVDEILPEIFKADAVISGGASNFAVVHNGNSQLLDAAALVKIKTYWNDCSNAAETHYSAIGSTTKSQAQKYDLSTGWPDPRL